MDRFPALQACALLLACATLTRADMALTLFDPSSGALCSDGSPAGFYFEASASGDNSKWVIELEGGGICESYDDCVSRQGSDLGSSKNWGPFITDGGQNSRNCTVNPDFCDFNHVFLPYCSGDIWSGNQTEASNPFGDGSGGPRKFVFAGHTILQAAVAELKAYVGSAGEGVKEILLEGCSAGGIGTFTNADWVAAQFPKATVRANPQAGYFGLGIDRYAYFSRHAVDPDPHHYSDDGWMANISKYVSPAMEHCMANDPAAGALLCSTPPRFYPFTTTPMFVSENTADSYQVFVQGGCPQSEEPEAVAFVQYLRGILAGSLHSNVVQGAKAATDGLFAPACLAHCLAWNGDGAPVVDGRTHQQAMGDWYYGRDRAMRATAPRGGAGEATRSHMHINDDDSIDTLLSCTDYGSYDNSRIAMFAGSRTQTRKTSN